MGKLQQSFLCGRLMLGQLDLFHLSIWKASSVQFSSTPLHQLRCAYREMSLCGPVTFWKDRRHRTSNSRALCWPLCASLLLLLLFSSLSLLSSDRVTGLVAASSKARPHARRFTTSAQSFAPRATTQKRTRRKRKGKKKDLRPTWSRMSLRQLLLAFHFNLQPLAAVADS